MVAVVFDDLFHSISLTIPDSQFILIYCIGKVKSTPTLRGGELTYFFPYLLKPLKLDYLIYQYRLSKNYI